jgi:hypothetical protein
MLQLTPKYPILTTNQCCGSALVTMRIRIQLFTLMQGTKPMRIYADPDPGLSRHQKKGFGMKNLLYVRNMS